MPLPNDPPRVRLTITETDEINTPFATYVYSETSSKGRVDILPKSLESPSSLSSSLSDDRQRLTLLSSWIASLKDVFLPVGYPHSVSADYLEYQIYDSVQAFSSSIAGLLSSRAVLQGVGVGDAAASPTSALLLQILQDISGRLATIIFAHRVGSALEPECKAFRLAADVFNDVAMVLDCISPLVNPRPARVAVISSAGVLRALCGVAAGSSKASLSAHFAKWGNIGELNAKDSSQETIISLLGMLAGSLVVSHVTSLPATWICLLSLLAIHLATNHRAVRAVQMTSLNRQRANIVFSTVFETDDLYKLRPSPTNTDTNQRGAAAAAKFLHPDEAAHREKVFERDGILRWFSSSSTEKLGWCRIGSSVQELISSSSSTLLTTSLPKLVRIFTSEQYILVPHKPISQRGTTITILLKQNCTPTQQLKAWAHALLVARLLASSSSPPPKSAPSKDSRTNIDDDGEIMEILSTTLTSFSPRFDDFYVPELKRAGWDLGIAALETRAGRRIDIADS